MILKLLIFGLCFGVSQGFLCYSCSFGGVDANAQNVDTRCLEQLHLLPDTTHIKCGNFCVTSVVFNKQSREVASFTRTCSVDWGNQCVTDELAITCKTTCEGNFCNEGYTVDLYSTEEPTVCDPYFGCGGHPPPDASPILSCSAALTLILTVVCLTFS